MNNVNWNAVAAIGQWVGSIGTLLAVMYSLWVTRRTTKAHAKVEMDFSIYNVVDKGEIDVVRVRIVNSGLVNIKVLRAEIRAMDHWQRYVPKLNKDFPKTIEPGDAIVYVEDPWELAKVFHIDTDPNNNQVFIFAVFEDSLGRKYQSKFYDITKHFPYSGERKFSSKTPQETTTT